MVANAVLPGSGHQDRRGLLKSSADAAWKFANWLTHAKAAHLNDAEAAIGSTELTMSLFTTGLIRYVRGVPDRCPSCGSQRLSPERGIHSDDPDTTYERPVCEKCGWTSIILGQARYFLSCDRKVTEMRQARCYRRLAKPHRVGYFSAMNPILFVEKMKKGEIE
jgi:hypothetical protein